MRRLARSSSWLLGSAGIALLQLGLMTMQESSAYAQFVNCPSGNNCNFSCTWSPVFLKCINSNPPNPKCQQPFQVCTNCLCLTQDPQNGPCVCTGNYVGPSGAMAEPTAQPEVGSHHRAPVMH